MEQDESLMNEQWSNGACLGYVICALESLCFSRKDIQRVVAELHWTFDVKSVEEAAAHYGSSPY